MDAKNIEKLVKRAKEEDKIWIIVHEMTWHTFQVYSISDEKKVLTGIQK